MSATAKQVDKTITLTVTTTRGTASFTFDQTTKIEEAIQQIRDHFELTGEGTFTLVRESDGTELTPQERPLVSFQLQDDEKLVLTGGGRNV